MPNAPYFSAETFAFLADLAANNQKEWFLQHKPRFEAHVQKPALAFIAAMQTPLAQISPQFVASAKVVGGSLFRAHRDTRFSNDKSPYKTHIGINFYHQATKATARGSAANSAMGRLDAPVFYLHIEPQACFIGSGVWHPQADTLKRIRNYMINNPKSWQAATQSTAFCQHWKLVGESLQRPPVGIAADHPLVTDLKRKSFVCSLPLADSEVYAASFVNTVSTRLAETAAMMDWLCGALDLEF